MKLFALFSAIIFLLGAATAQRSQVQCKQSVPTLCVLENVELTRDDTRYDVISENPEAVVCVLIANSVIPILSGDICETFPNLQQLNVQAQGVESLEPNAFAACGNLEVLYLNNNSIAALPPRVFHSAVNLRSLFLYNNSISTIDEQQFSANVELTELHLDHNLLTHFPVQAVANLQQLVVLFLENNDLFDLDVATLTSLLPDLQNLLINYNLIPCRRLREILEIFVQENVVVNTFGDPKERIFNMCNIEGLACVDDDCSCQREPEPERN